ncbi:Alt-like RNA polymerase ADP-ribosyltransferase [Escherichia phage vB_EcoM_005]|uniref:NAD(+)--arginine ADP-ribosyltransferase n=1 Tax=Escherichia phage vB_EcoM_005 TaxID=2500761 RepID=A0A3T0ILI7_9CAUD|nr:Alt-like RNA polymerase ADP-ribosyltransferase [Escherichia phage vB_EcoM_005]AZV00917.1 RNA polymerase ADP-ribosylase [Escherichia phage vB_EcoM_005]
MTEQLNEVFESEGTLPTVNLNPKLKVPQIWKIGDAESQLVARMVSYASEGDAIKQVKLGDKYAHVILMSLSAKGTPAELKGGLGPTPVDAINTIFDVVYDQVKKLRMDAVMFRFPTKKMKGQGPIVQRIIQRLVAQKTGGRFKVVPAMYQFTGKHTYILVVRKQADIEDIKGMPGINSELYTKVDSDVGEVYISKKEGAQVTKETAIAGSIAKVEERRTDKMVITKTKISRRAIAASQSLEADRNEGELFQKYEQTANEFSAPATAELIPQAAEVELSLSSETAKDKLATAIDFKIYNTMDDSFKFADEVSYGDKINSSLEKFVKKIKNEKTTSVKALAAFVEVANEIAESIKSDWFEDYRKDNFHLEKEILNENSERVWKQRKSSFLSKIMYTYAIESTREILNITTSRDPKQYTLAEKRAIREYASSAYVDINNVLLGRYKPGFYEVLDESEVKRAIDGMDSAFKNGDRLPEGIMVYRAQSLRAPIYEALVKNKVFYFRNYVSTSLAPIIFGGFKENAAIGLASDDVRKELNIDNNDEGVTISASQVRTHMYAPDQIRVDVGWAISGAHKVNVIYPGQLSMHANEKEIILPRGLLVKIDKIVDASANTGSAVSNNKFIQAEVMTSDELQESVVYDGDVLVETGELVVYQDDFDTSESPVSFDSFVKSTRVDVLTLLASCIDLYDIPEKFIQG